MKKITLLLAALLVAGVVQAQPNGNASVGTKELLARIEALEALVAALDPPDGSVSGSAYQVLTSVNGLFNINELPVSGGALIGSTLEWSFFSDGTGQSESLACDGWRFHDQDFNADPAFVTHIPNCQTTGTINSFTWSQVGNDLEVNIDGLQFTLFLTVSADAGALQLRTMNFMNSFPCSDGPCTITNFNIATFLGIRLGESE